VDWDTFWDLNPRLLKAFVEADRIRTRKREAELYVQGAYVFEAVGLALGNGFREKGKQPLPWREEPIRLLPYTEEEQAAIADRERKRAIAYFNSLIPKEERGENNGS